MFNLDTVLIHGAGFSSLKDSLVTDWLGPVLLIVIAIYGIILAWKRELRQAGVALVIFIVAAVLVFFGDDLFSESGSAVKGAKDIGTKIGQTTDISSLPIGK